MEIRMPISFHGNYQVVVRSGDSESREKCQKLTVSQLPSGESAKPAEGDASTHLVIFYSFGCKRIVEGTLKVNEQERLVVQSRDKEYEFSPVKPPVRP